LPGREPDSRRDHPKSSGCARARGKSNYCRLGGELAPDRDLSVRLVADPAPDRALPAASRRAVASQIQLARRRCHRRIRKARVEQIDGGAGSIFRSSITLLWHAAGCRGPSIADLGGEPSFIKRVTPNAWSAERFISGSQCGCQFDQRGVRRPPFQRVWLLRWPAASLGGNLSIKHSAAKMRRWGTRRSGP
jgi:hypothetical protein